MGTKNRLACKCSVCKKAFNAAKVGQLYCSAKCCQRAYRARKAKAEGKRKSDIASHEKPQILHTCGHCGGGFFAKTRRAEFCSTSCRTLHHRALKAALPAAIAAVWGVPTDKAYDLIETQSIGELKRLLVCMGYQYQHERRAWIVS